MNNIRSTVLASLAALCVMATISLATPPPKAPVFVDCPEQHRACAGDSIFLQVKAVHPASNKSNGVRYFMVDGPGSVDPVTGVWSYWTEDTGRVMRRPFPVEIGASIGNSPHQTYAEQNCVFEVYISQPRKPRFKFNDQTDVGIFAAQYGTPLEIDVWAYDPYDCGVEITVDNISPEFAGSYEFADDTVLVINIAEADMEKRFVFTIKGETHGLIGYGTIVVETRSEIPAPVFVDCPDQPVMIDLCDYKTVSVVAVSPPYDDSLGIEYEIVSGPGWIDRNGYWQLSWDPNYAGQTFDIEIAASYLGQSTSPDGNCKFTVEFADPPPLDFSQYYLNPCGDTVEAKVHEAGSIALAATAYVPCLPVEMYVVSVTPEPAGHIGFDFPEYDGFTSLYYNFATEDAGQIFDITVAAARGADTAYCQFYISVLEPEPIKVRIEFNDFAFQGQYYNIAVDLVNASIDLGGFDFLISYPAQMLSLQQVEFGEVFDENGCGWEYFTYRFEAPGLLIMVGIAETNNGPIHPSCWTPETLPAEIASLRFLVSNDPIYEGVFAPITFLWNDCSDNGLANSTGSDFYISSKVLDHLGNEITDPTVGSYPTDRGAQDIDCFNDPINLPIRNVEFQNGGIGIVFVEPIDVIGDVNLNGISYEIADYIVFSAYLIFGGDAFTVDLEGQLAATDVNTDNVLAQVEDLTYLGAVIRGDLLPHQGPFPPSTETLILNRPNANDLDIQYTGTDEIGALLLVVADSVDVTLMQTGPEMGYSYNGSTTRILISGWDGEYIENGLLLSGLDGHEVLEFSAATADGKKIMTQIDVASSILNGDILPESFAVYQNYPNPFNPSTTVHFDLPQAATVRFEVINILGAVVYDFSRDYSAGNQEITWRGVDNNGNQVASGVYYYRIEAGEFSQARKMILLK